MPPTHLSRQQSHYLDSIIDKSYNELLFEIARGMLSGVTASAGPGYETKSGGPKSSNEEDQKFQLSNVPREPVDEFLKPALEPHLSYAEKKVQALHSQVYQLVCNAEEQKPKEWALDASTGQTKDIVVGVVSALTAKYSIAMGIAIPVVVYLLKKGLYQFCSASPLPL